MKKLEGLNMFNGTNLTLRDQYTYGKVTKSQKKTKELRDQPFNSRWPQGWKEQTREPNKDKPETYITKNDLLVSFVEIIYKDKPCLL